MIVVGRGRPKMFAWFLVSHSECVFYKEKSDVFVLLLHCDIILLIYLHTVSSYIVIIILFVFILCICEWNGGKCNFGIFLYFPFFLTI